MYIAIEYTDDLTVNDWGHVTDTKEEAWDVVKDTFYAPNTRIHKIETLSFFCVTTQKPIFTKKGKHHD